MSISNSTLQGGGGDVSNVTSLNEIDVNGGHGYEDQGIATSITLDTSSFNGGSGGFGTNSQGSIVSYGGDGVNIERGDLSFTGNFDPSIINISSGDFTGGDGGTTSLFKISDPSFYDQTNLDIPGSHGGHGFRFTRLDQFPPTLNGYTDNDKISINDGVFTGGNGGVVLNSTNGLISAQGGSGLFVDYADVVINGGTFSGGAAGTTNGILDRVGAGVHAQDANLIINGGVFNTNGLGLRVENRYYDTVNTISNGVFGKIEYISNVDDYSGGTFIITSNRVTRANIYGGSISNITLSGVTFNNVNIHGGNIGSINFSSSGVGADSIFISSASSIDDIKILSQSSNTVNFENNLLPINTRLDLGLGNLYSTNLITQSGNQIKSTFSDNNSGSIPNTGVLSGENFTFTSGTSWELVNDTLNPFTNFQELSNTNGFLLASTTGSITNNLLVDDVSLAGNTEWLLGITGFQIISDGLTQNLYASYGFGQLSDILNASDDLLIIANELQPVIEANTDLRLYIQTQYNSAEELSIGLANSFLQTPEVANISIDIQSKISDQVRVRQKQHRKYRYFGNAIIPQGPSGWVNDTRNYITRFFPGNDAEKAESNKYEAHKNNRYEYLPNVKINETLKNAERSIPEGRQFKSNINQINERLSEDVKNDEIIPVRKAYVSGYVGKGRGYNAFTEWIDDLKHTVLNDDYQTWGRGYFTDVNREGIGNQFGYQARINGAIIGFDRKNEHFMGGFSGGLAETSLIGDSDNDADMTSLHIGSYLSVFSKKSYVDANINYTWNYIDTSGPLSTKYTSNYEANNLSFSINSGININLKNKLFITPEISHISSLYSREAYKETSSINDLPIKNYDTYDQWSHQTEIGMTMMLLELIDNPRLQMIFRPELRVFWLHTHNPQLDSETYSFQNNVNLIKTSLLSREENLIRIGAGINFWDLNKYNTEFSLDVDYVSGASLKEYTFGGSFIHRF